MLCCHIPYNFRSENKDRNCYIRGTHNPRIVNFCWWHLWWQMDTISHTSTVPGQATCIQLIDMSLYDMFACLWLCSLLQLGDLFSQWSQVPHTSVQRSGICIHWRHRRRQLHSASGVKNWIEFLLACLVNKHLANTMFSFNVLATMRVESQIIIIIHIQFCFQLTVARKREIWRERQQIKTSTLIITCGMFPSNNIIWKHSLTL